LIETLLQVLETDMQIRGDAVSATGVSKRYRRTVALDGFSITLPFGVVVGLAGPNGAGETTALGILAGSIKPTTESGPGDGH
jgi:ABC-2 type transport system ATP-binding protein